MLFRNMFLKYYAATDDGGEGGAPSGGEPDITPEMQQIIDARINTAVTGLKTKNNELLGTIKQQKENLARFDGIDPDAVRSILQRFSDDEEAKLIAEGKIDDVLNKRTERLRQDVDKQIKAANDRADKAEAFAGKFRDRVLGDAIRGAALKSGALAGATDDIFLRARNVFTLNDDGEAVAVDAEGNPVLGKDGKSPLAPAEWIDSLKESAPHLFTQGEGTGAGPGKVNHTGAMKRSEMTSQQKTDFIRKHGQQAYLRLPKE